MTPTSHANLVRVTLATTLRQLRALPFYLHFRLPFYPVEGEAVGARNYLPQAKKPPRGSPHHGESARDHSLALPPTPWTAEVEVEEVANRAKKLGTHLTEKGHQRKKEKMCPVRLLLRWKPSPLSWGFSHHRRKQRVRERPTQTVPPFCDRHPLPFFLRPGRAKTPKAVHALRAPAAHPAAISHPLGGPHRCPLEGYRWPPETLSRPNEALPRQSESSPRWPPGSSLSPTLHLANPSNFSPSRLTKTPAWR